MFLLSCLLRPPFEVNLQALRLNLERKVTLWGHTWPYLGASWAQLGASWVPLGRNLEPLGRALGGPGALGVPWGGPGRPWGGPGGALGGPGGPLGRLFKVLYIEKIPVNRTRGIM